MPDMSGLDLIRAKNISNALPVLITSHPEFALDGFEVEAFDYLVKPVSADRFAHCAYRLRDYFDMRRKACEFEEQQESGSIVIKQGHDKYKLSLAEILYLEAMKDYTRIKTESGQYLVLTGLARFLVEFIRRNPTVLWGFSNAQLASAGAVLVGVALTWWAATRPERSADKAPAAVAKTA